MDPTGNAYALAIAVLISVVYLIIIRFVDMNEKEPLWSLGLLFSFGVIAAIIARVLVNWTYIDIGLTWPAIVENIAMFIAIAGGIWMLFLIGAARGRSEVSGAMDGVVYGATAGLGYAIGAILVRQLTGSAIDLPIISAWDVLWTNALIGLFSGVLGGIIGFGFGASVYGSSTRRTVLPILMLILAIFADLAYRRLSFANAMGQDALLRRWIGLLIPIGCIVVLAGWALWREKSAIRKQLRDETSSGAVTSDEYDTLLSVANRQKLYLSSLFAGRWTQLAGLKTLHNRQVQLALVKQRRAAEADPGRQSQADREIAALRQSIAQTRGMMSDTAVATGAL